MFISGASRKGWRDFQQDLLANVFRRCGCQKEIEQICIMRHRTGNPGMGPIAPPNHAIPPSFDDRADNVNHIRIVWRADFRTLIKAVEINPGMFLVRKNGKQVTKSTISSIVKGRCVSYVIEDIG
jgi:hypothetical protein